MFAGGLETAEGDVIRQALAVLLVFALLGVAVWKLRGAPFAARSTGARLASSGRLALTPQHTVHLVRIDGRELVIATHPRGCSLLNEAPQLREGSA